jgi:inosine-uridine nucleoside N-ribohydrolase
VLRSVIIDCDPGVDDMVALLLACASDSIDVLGVTTVCGNVGVAQTTRNALAALSLAGREDVPVSRGAPRALIRTAVRHAESVHGGDGLGGALLPPSGREPERRHAIEFMAQTVTASPHPVTLIGTGPLTNVALFFAHYPEIASRLENLIIMGGAVEKGNVSDVAEFNIWSDPESAYRVLTDTGLPEDVPTTVVSLDVAAEVTLDTDDLGHLRKSGRCGRLAADALGGQYLRRFKKVYERSAVPIYDALTVIALLHADLIRTVPVAIEVDTSLGSERGRTRIRYPDANEEFVKQVISVEAEADKIAELIVNHFARLP